ncbi:MAG: Low molecular weight protein-tyrosine-phosphatase YwlE [Planctomycetota bacterium]|jgi:protein-tyrosine phosphatase
MPVVIDVNSSEDPRDIVHRAVQALAEGKLVAFPTETVYGLAASALHESAVQKLFEVKGRQPGQAFALAVRSADEALDYLPGMSSLAMRLARRCWPGPMTLVVDVEHPDSLLGRIPSRARELIAPLGTVGLRVPAHPIIHNVLRLAVGPLVLTSANKAGEPDAVTAAEVVNSVGNDVSLVIDDGRCKFAQPSSVVRVRGQSYYVLRHGVIVESTLRRLASYILLLVCTGNTCRSPMAEVLMRKRFAEKLGCKLEELEDRGVMIMSAGIAAMAGGRATVEANEAVKAWGLDLTSHESQPLSDRLVRFADTILTMTRGHRDAILSHWPEASMRTRLLSANQQDIGDPIGGPQELYRRCCEQIDSQIVEWLKQFDVACLPQLSTETPPKN